MAITAQRQHTRDILATDDPQFEHTCRTVIYLACLNHGFCSKYQGKGDVIAGRHGRIVVLKRKYLQVVMITRTRHTGKL